jgi:predicted acyltransferase
MISIKNQTMENEKETAVKRLYSLDALRGFDMFWIMGGEAIFAGLASLTGWPVVQWWAGQMVLLLLFPAHDLGSTDVFSREGNLTSHIDRLLMPGRLYLGNHDPEGLFSTLPAIGTALLGMFTGEFLLSKYLADKPLLKVLYLILAAVTLMVIGKIWNIAFPINKNLWTSSFVCFVGGLSLLFFSIFYLIIDVWEYKKWAFVFVVIGMNPITIYLTGRIVNFGSATKFFFGGIASVLPGLWTPLIYGIGVTAIGWIFLYVLYKKKIFLKI